LRWWFEVIVRGFGVVRQINGGQVMVKGFKSKRVKALNTIHQG